MTDRATPNLPSRNLKATVDFYTQLGFEETFHDEGWLIVERDPIQIEFFPHPAIDPKTTIASCCIRVEDLDALHQAVSAADLPVSNTSTPRLTEPSDKPWGRDAGIRVS